MAVPLLRDVFYHDGRGPELHAAYFAHRGLHLIAVDYWLPDVSHDVRQLRHLEFNGAQVFMVTPEEVANHTKPQLWSANGVAAYSVGRSEWLESFSPIHLSRCEHFRLMFYDEYLDVICVSITSHEGSYLSRAHL